MAGNQVQPSESGGGRRRTAQYQKTALPRLVKAIGEALLLCSPVPFLRRPCRAGRVRPVGNRARKRRAAGRTFAAPGQNGNKNVSSSVNAGARRPYRPCSTRPVRPSLA